MIEPFDYKFLSEGYAGEYIAKAAYGSANKYFTGGNNGAYVPKSKRTDNYLVEAERHELEKDLLKQEQSLISDLNQESSNYKTRLYLNSMLDGVDLDLCSTNIVKTYKIWDGKKKFPIITRDDPTFSLYDIYIKITSTDDFTKKDLLNFVNVKFYLEIGGQSIFSRDFFSTLLFEHLDDQDIIIESNVLYLRVFTFNNFLYGIPKTMLSYHQVHINIYGLNDVAHSKYLIDALYSGKNLYSIDFKKEHINAMEQVIVQSQDTSLQIKSGQKFHFLWNLPVQIIMFFLYEDSNEETDELNRLEIESIGLYLNGHPIWWNGEEIIYMNFMGLELCILCIDDNFRNMEKFKKYVNNDLDMDTMKSINFSRIDSTKFVLNYNSDKKYNLFMTGMCINVLRIMSGMAGLAFCL